MVDEVPNRNATIARSHRQILQAQGQTAVFRHLQSVGFPIASASVVLNWAAADSIPGPYWKALAEAGFATIDELAEYAASKKRRAVMDTAG